MFDPKTGKYTHINDVPRVYGLALDKDGNCWFAENIQNGKIGRVDAKTLRVTKWAPPTTDGRPRRIQIADDGTIWFAEFRSGKIAHFDPKTDDSANTRSPALMPRPMRSGSARTARSGTRRKISTSSVRSILNRAR